MRHEPAVGGLRVFPLAAILAVLAGSGLLYACLRWTSGSL
jgi:hypothetical protein